MKPTILVTGAPRSGTTPLGQILSTLPGSVSLYEPMGPTGDQRFRMRFPIPGEPDFTTEDFAGFLHDLERLNLRFKPQRRPGHRGIAGLAARLFGTRSLLTYRLAKVTPGRRLLVWKDPHAVFCAPFVARFGFRAVVSLRSPHAHAASFKRLGWVSKIDAIYPRYRSVHGEIPGFEGWMTRLRQDPVGSAALLWHLIHTQYVTPETREGVLLLNMESVAGNERQAYAGMFEWLGEPMPARAEALLSRRERKGQERASGLGQRLLPGKRKVHDFNRTAEQANAYWPDVLSKSEIAVIDELNGALWAALQAP